MKKIVFFNNKGGVGKTTFTYHIGYALEKNRKEGAVCGCRSTM